MSIPKEPKIYHITHIDNLEKIMKSGALLSEARVNQSKQVTTKVGMESIKRRRLEEIKITCYEDKIMVGECVPFNFCPRSVMLYILYRGNHPSIQHYTEGQTPIIHLQYDLKSVINWITKNNINWSFTDRNASDALTSFYNNFSDLGKINWNAVNSRDFTESNIKSEKQAEFLIYDEMPINLLDRIGVHNDETKQKVNKILQKYPYNSIEVDVKKEWYF